MTEPTPPPPSRRERRAARTTAADPSATADSDLLADEFDVDRRKRRRVWLWVSIALVVLIGLGVGAWAANRLYTQAQDTRSHLLAAMPHVAEAKAAMLASDPAGAAAAAAAFREEALAAQKTSSGKLWDLVEGIPLPPMENLRAVSTVSDVAVDLADDVLMPASEVSITALAPSGGRMDVAALQSLADLVSGIVDGTEAADDRLGALDDGALIEQVRAGVRQVDAALDEIRAIAVPARDVLAVLPDALGASGPRQYLVMFQGNAEMRASGGGPGSFVLLKVEDGALSIVREAAATEFAFDIPQPVVPIDAETEALYSDIVARWVANLTGTPDFPTSAALARGWWSTLFADQVDGVISIDPIGLSYMLNATGPISLPTGDVLTSENAAPLLLNEAYFKYPDGVDSNRFFSAVSLSVFAALTGGNVQPLPMVAALTKATDEGRLKLWSANEQETALLGESRLSGRLPTTNDDESAVGVFFNDTTGSKMDYYVDATVGVTTDQCTAEAAPNWTTTVTLQNRVSAERARGLPRYITGPYFTPGEIGTDFIVYTPVGAKIESWTLNGNTYDAIAHTTHLGRDAVRINVILKPQETATFQVTMVGADGSTSADFAPPSVRHTPMVRETPVTIDAPGCE
ncbi:DUF4012 domain-containing protein [Microbacterium sp. 179-I 3D3 NHS]|uniref:DUF4012 domain-containing protein n=1 Tax=Microbacterium sp. 179-I 3D3 NHS TaxID=3142382 RepID=UPI00399F7B6C